MDRYYLTDWKSKDMKTIKEDYFSNYFSNGRSVLLSHFVISLF